MLKSTARFNDHVQKQVSIVRNRPPHFMVSFHDAFQISRGLGSIPLTRLADVNELMFDAAS